MRTYSDELSEWVDMIKAGQSFAEVRTWFTNKLNELGDCELSPLNQIFMDAIQYNHQKKWRGWPPH
jgi:hypothetical protein